MSDRPTPETDAALNYLRRKNEAMRLGEGERHSMYGIQMLIMTLKKLERERNEVREELADWRMGSLQRPPKKSMTLQVACWLRRRGLLKVNYDHRGHREHGGHEMSDTNCPYCGEPEETDTPTGITIYRCGTLIYPNGSSVKPLICDLGRDLRREREAHNQTKRERDEARSAYDLMSARASEWEKRWLAANAENAKLRDIAKRAIYSMEWDYGNPHARAKMFRAKLDQIKEGGK